MDAWLSFADLEKKKSLGVVIVEDIPAFYAPKMDKHQKQEFLLAAIRKSWELGLNPGGEVLGGPYDGPGPRNRLLSPTEALLYGDRLDGEGVGHV